jgi:hypothetical protein
VYRARLWSTRNAGFLNGLYRLWETLLTAINPLMTLIGHDKLDKGVTAIEGAVKGFLFDSQSCGQCTLGYTGMACPMNCPKSLRNGPCGGVRADGTCEIDPHIRDGVQAIQVIQAPLDSRLSNTSSWLRAVRERKLVRDAIRHDL